MCLTLYFDGQFWVGVFEEAAGDGLAVFRHVFGAEPRDAEVLAFVRALAVPALLAARDAPPPRIEAASPKRLAREAARAVNARGVGTRSQEALKAAHATDAAARAAHAREERDREAERRRAMAREKARKRHRGH